MRQQNIKIRTHGQDGVSMEAMPFWAYEGRQGRMFQSPKALMSGGEDRTESSYWLLPFPSFALTNQYFRLPDALPTQMPDSTNFSDDFILV